MKKLPSVYDIEGLQGKRVLVRASLNVPLVDGEVRNAFRIKRALLTLRYLQSKGAKVVVIAHIGREKDETLKPVYEALKEHIDLNFISALEGDMVQSVLKEMTDGSIVLLENIRQHDGETQNDAKFATLLASYGDVFINDAFAASHREHTSTVGIAKLLPSYFGINFLHEVEELDKALSPTSPSVFILGGAKFETKMPLIEKFVPLYDTLLIGGALSNDFYKAEGFEVGKSLVSPVDLKGSEVLKAKNIITPVDVVVQNAAGEVRTCAPNEVQKDEIIFDAGLKTIETWAEYVDKAATILWNGPLGDYEKGFEEGTEALAKVISKASGYSIIGGGDTIAAVEAADVGETFGFMSTGGGAMLTYLETGTLPAIEAVMGKKK